MYSLKSPQMNEIFQYFADVLFVTIYAGCSHPATGQIFKNKTWLFIASRNFCRVQGIARANEQPSFIFKNLSSSRMRASRIVTSKTSAKY